MGEAGEATVTQAAEESAGTKKGRGHGDQERASQDLKLTSLQKIDF